MATQTRSGRSGALNTVTPDNTDRLATSASISALSRGTGYVNTATSTAHGLSVGDYVYISGATNTATDGHTNDFNGGPFRVDSAADADTFTYSSPYSGSLTATGTIVFDRAPVDARGSYLEQDTGSGRNGYRLYTYSITTGGNDIYDLVQLKPSTGTAFSIRWGGSRGESRR